MSPVSVPAVFDVTQFDSFRPDPMVNDGAMTSTRLITLDDVPALTELITANREFMVAWEPLRADDYFTEAGQIATITAAILSAEQGLSLPHVILDESGALAGRITFNGIVRGPFQSCAVGYWVGEQANGRGVATAALAEMLARAFGDLGLHRVQAETLPHNVRSQRVLEKHGFQRIGMAPTYLNIAGTWQDHVMFQLINPAA